MGPEEAMRNGAQITEFTARENHCNPGYLVEYPDGYRSWSPKKAFEEAYRISETEEDRLKIELADLNTRMKEATDKLFNPNHYDALWARSKKLDTIQTYADERFILGKQLDAMREYAEKLWVRIENLKATRSAPYVDTYLGDSSLNPTEKGGE